MGIKLELEVQEVEVVIGGLSQLPFARVESIINNIRQQAVPQLQQPRQQQDQEVQKLPDQQ